MKVITYSLKDTQKNSDRYYQQVADFTDEFLVQAESLVRPLVDQYIDFIATYQIETPRSFAEYAIELLLVGVLWREYAPDAVKINWTSRNILAGLVRARQKSTLLKPGIDVLRGWLGQAVLPVTFHRREKDVRPPLTLPNLRKLTGWLEAAGDFPEETARIRQWLEYFAVLPPSALEKDLASVLALAAWFETHSLQALGMYTARVDDFLEEDWPHYKFREDRVLCGRRRVEYHLNMVGTEILNRAFRPAFMAAEHKIIFVPPCMAAPQDGTCQAVDTPLGAKCQACTPTCRVHQVTKLGEKYGAQVFMIPDSFSPLTNGAGGVPENTTIGVVGVSCPLTIISGGLETQRMGVPAQGLLLDYCGCPWHWDVGKGIVTDINMHQLTQIMTDQLVG